MFILLSVSVVILPQVYAMNHNQMDIESFVTSETKTHPDSVFSSSASYRFGQTVIVTLYDPDLNLKSDRIDVYSVVNDPRSPAVDTVGNNEQILLEILIKYIRYKRYIVDGVENGGLASTGFTLVETGPSTGIFEGSFRMPSQICQSGIKLISTAGGNVNFKYHDARDSSGESNITSRSTSGILAPMS